MQRIWTMLILSTLAAVSFAQEPRSTGSICVKHLETPIYPPIARAVHVVGKVELKVTIDEAGRVVDTRVVSGSSLFRNSANENMKGWIFGQPPSQPYSLVVVYDYELDCSDPIPRYPVTKVTFDLPSQVKIVTTCVPIETIESKSQRRTD